MADLVRLDEYLFSDDSPDDYLLLSDLDGFLHGVACSPVEIGTEEWMRGGLRGAADDCAELGHRGLCCNRAMATPTARRRSGGLARARWQFARLRVGARIPQSAPNRDTRQRKSTKVYFCRGLI